MGIFDGVPEDIEVKTFFEEKLPAAFETELGGAVIEGMDGTVLKVIFNIAGEPYGLTVTDAKSLEVSPGGVEGADIEIELSQEAWRDAVSGALGNALDMFTDFNKMADRRRYDIIKEVKGKLKLVLERPDAGPFEVEAKFGGADAPEVTISTDLGTWQEIMAGSTQAAMAFMGGKLKLTGEMPLAMQLNGLM